MTELDNLVVRITGDQSHLKRTFAEAEQTVRQVSGAMESVSTSASRQIAAAQTQTGEAAAAAAQRQTDASARTTAALRSQATAAQESSRTVQDSLDRMGTGLKPVSVPIGVQVDAAQAQQSVRSAAGQVKVPDQPVKVTADIEAYTKSIKALPKPPDQVAKVTTSVATSGQQATAAGQEATRTVEDAAGKPGRGAFKSAALAAAPYVAMGAAAKKAAEEISDLINNTAGFRRQLMDLEYATNKQIAAMQRLGQSQLAQLGRSDAPLEKRLADFDKEIAVAEKARTAAADAFEKLDAADQLRKNIGRGAGAAAGAAAGTAIAPGPGTFIGAVGGLLLGPEIDKILNPQETKLREQQLEAAKKAVAQQEAQVKALMDARQGLMEALKDAAHQQQAASREAIALARVPEFLKGGEKLKRQGLGEEEVKATQQLATQEMAEKFSAETDKASRMLGLQAVNVTANAAQLRVLEAALDGVSGAQLEVMRTSADANKLKEQNLEIAKQVQSLKEEAAAIGKTAVAAELARKAAAGFNAEQLDALKPQLMIKRGKEVTEQFLLPQQKFVRSMQELNELYEAGAINQVSYARAAQDANKQLEGQHAALQAIQGAASGSAEALERFDKFQDAISLKKVPNVKDYRDSFSSGIFAAAQGRTIGQPGQSPIPPALAGAPPPRAVETNPPSMDAQRQKDSEYLRRIAEATEHIRDRPGPDIGLGLGG